MPNCTSSSRAPWAVLLGSLLCTLAVAIGFARAHQASDRARFTDAIDDVEDAVRQRLDTYEALLYATRGLFATDSSINREGFHQYVASLDLRDRYPGLRALGYTRRVTRAQLPALVEHMRAEGIESFHVWPESADGEVIALLYAEPIVGNSAAAIGFDMDSEPQRREAVERARDTGAPAATGRVPVLAQVDPHEPGAVLTYLPVYEGEPTTVEARRAQLRGLVFYGFRTEVLFQSIFAHDAHPWVALTVIDSDGTPVYRLATPGDSPRDRPSHEAARELPVAGHTWRLEFRSRPAFDELSPIRQVGYVVATGLLFSLALFGVTRNQVQARAAAESSALRLSILAAATARLGATLEYSSTLGEVAQLPVPSFADGCAIDLLGANQHLERVATHHVDARQMAISEQLISRFPQPPDSPRGPAAVARTRQFELVPQLSRHDMDLAASSPEHGALLSQLDIRSYMCVPLVARDRMLGTLTFVRGHRSRPYQAEDVAFADEFASRAAAALENARLHREARASEAEAQAQRARLHALFMQAPVNIAIHEGPDHVFTLANPSYRQAFAGRDLVGLPAREVFPIAPLVLDEVYRTGVPFEGREQLFQIDRGSGKWEDAYFNLLIQPIIGPEGRTGIISFAFEVTDLVLARKHKEALNADLEAAVRARDTFVAVASHELRTPMTTLQLQSDGLLRSLERAPLDSERLRYRVGKIQQQTMRLNHLINDLLDVSRIATGRLSLSPEPADLLAIVKEAISRSEDALSRAGCTVELHADGPVAGSWDKLRIDQVLINLLTNAAKYGAGKPVAISVSADEQLARVEVRDHGIGIAPEDQLRIFERFERAVSERNFGGLGLGLWISRQIVTAHGGSIRVESRAGEGSTFTLELPRRTAQQAGGAGASFVE